jgi:ketosteroid isomerase-like protein
MKTEHEDHDDLEARVRRLEDQLALFQLIASWGPAADTADGTAAAALWTDDAVLQAEATIRVEGPAGVFEMIDSAGQRELVDKGCAHVQGLPLMSIDGDRATATNYGRVYVHGDDGYDVWRVSVNRWEFRRTPDGWRAAARTVHTVDGGPEAQALLSRAIDRNT